MKPGKPYQPSNGTEGMMFSDCFCDKCEKDRKYRKNLAGRDSCPILPLTMLYDPGDTEYPAEWIYDENGNPTCTAFTPELTEEQQQAKRFAEKQAALEAAGQQVLF